MSFFDTKIDPREAQYGRFASGVLRTLKDAVYARKADGITQRNLADRLGWDDSQLSRVLNGRVRNISIQTVSDILWACDYEPEVFTATPLERICHNTLLWHPQSTQTPPVSSAPIYRSEASNLWSHHRTETVKRGVSDRFIVAEQ